MSEHRGSQGWRHSPHSRDQTQRRFDSRSRHTDLARKRRRRQRQKRGRRHGATHCVPGIAHGASRARLREPPQCQVNNATMVKKL